MTKIFYNANTQYANTGDLLIHRSLLQSLSEYGEIIIENKTLPGWYLERLRVRNCSVLSDYTTGSITSYILKCCIAGRKKDTIYYVDGLGHKMSTGKKRAVRTIIASAKLLVLKIFGCRILRFGVTLGPYDKLNQIAEAIYSKNFYFYSARDRESLELAKKSGFKKTHYFPDLGWSYQLNNKGFAPAIDSENKKYIVLSFRGNSIGADTENSYVNYIVSKLEVLLSQFDPSTTDIVIAYQVEYDKETCESIAKRFSASHHVQLINERLFIEEAAAVYAKAELVISNRLHVLLLGSIAGSVPVAFMKNSRHAKVHNIFKLNNLLDLVIDTESNDQKIKEQIQKISASRTRYLELIDETIEANTKEKEIILNRIFTKKPPRGERTQKRYTDKESAVEIFS